VAEVISLSSRTLQLFAGTFGLLHAVLGFLNLGLFQKPNYVIAALVLYVVFLMLTVAFPGELEVPNWLASLNFMVAILLPLLVISGLGENPQTPYTIWYVAATGTLMAVTAVRGHRTLAWFGTVFLIAEILVWGGLGVLFNSGIVGAVLMVMGAQAASGELDASAKLAKRFREQALATEAATAAQTAARIERERRITQTLTGVLPQLELIAANRKGLSSKEKQTALLTEAALRDQIRGRGLTHPELVEQVRLARTRGVEVQLLDDGGFEDLTEQETNELLERVASELSSVKAGKVVIRSVSGEDWNLSVVALRKGEERPDLFLRL
jgi:hypothetical protein